MLNEAALIACQMPLMSGLPDAVRFATTGFGDCACAAAPIASAQNATSSATRRRMMRNGARLGRALCAKNVLQGLENRANMPNRPRQHNAAPRDGEAGR